MSKNITDIGNENFKIEFPKCNEILRKRSIDSFLADLEAIKMRILRFKSKNDVKNCNDLTLLLDEPESEERFIADAERLLGIFNDIIFDITEAMKYYEGIKEHAVALAKVSRQYDAKIKQYTNKLLDQGVDPLDINASVQRIENKISDKAQELLRRQAALDEVEQEIAITQDMLAKKKSEMEEALRTRYTLTDSQKQTLLEEKDKILDGVEKWGSVYGALTHDKTIKSKQSTISMYMQLFPEFGQAISVSKMLFKDRLEGIMIERAIEGTENPVFSKGEHVGDYKIKDNKMFMELMKAKVPEQYNKKAVEVNKGTKIDNVNIVSFANIDETKQGFTKDVGVVLDVDDTGKVTRIQQEKKMLEYYTNKEGAEIIDPDKPEEA